MFFRSLNIELKLVLSVAIAIIIGIIVLVNIVSVEVTSNVEKEAKDSFFLTLKRYVNHMEGILNESVVLTKGITTSLNAMFK